MLNWLPGFSHLLCISQSFVAILISHTQTNPSPPPLTIFQSSACTAVTPMWWAYSETTEEPERRSNTRTLSKSRRKHEQMQRWKCINYRGVFNWISNPVHQVTPTFNLQTFKVSLWRLNYWLPAKANIISDQEKGTKDLETICAHCCLMVTKAAKK